MRPSTLLKKPATAFKRSPSLQSQSVSGFHVSTKSELKGGTSAAWPILSLISKVCDPGLSQFVCDDKSIQHRNPADWA